MNITRWEPANDFSNLARNMERFFDEVWGRPQRGRQEADSLRGAWIPAVNILEKKDSIDITVEMPGVDAKDVEVTIEDGVLALRGERHFEAASEGETYHRVESAFGAFERRFTLPPTVDASKIDARFKNGIMTLHLPKREESKPRSVKVKVESN